MAKYRQTLNCLYNGGYTHLLKEIPTHRNVFIMVVSNILERQKIQTHRNVFIMVVSNILERRKIPTHTKIYRGHY